VLPPKSPPLGPGLGPPSVDDPIPRPVREAGGTILDALLGLAAEREDVRRALTTVNAWLARELNLRAEAARSSTSRVDATRPEGGRSEGSRVEAPRAESGHGVLVPRAPGTVGADDPRSAESRPVDLERVHARAAWKGEALRLALARRAAGAAPGPELRLREADLRARQSSAGGPWAWMLDAPPARVEDAALTTLAQCYEVVARVAEGLTQLERAEALQPAPPVELLRLVAETQSALLVALAGVGLRQDEDQRDLFQWLRERTTRHRIYVDRHMRLEDPADPSAAQDIGRRFEVLVEGTLAVGVGRKQRVQLLNKVRYHVRRLIDGGASSAEEWTSLAAALARWREHTLALDDKGLVDVLGALAGLEVPAAVTAAGAQQPEALGALAAALELVRGGETARADSLAEARRLVQGRRGLMVAEGTDDFARATLAEALGLEHLEWLAVGGVEPPAALDEQATDEPAPGAAAQPSERVAAILASLAETRPDVVFMGLRLPQDEYLVFKDRCVELRLPFVRLPGEPTPSAVAHQTLRQVGWRLRELRAEA
jgi:hypothetical protein